VGGRRLKGNVEFSIERLYTWGLRSSGTWRCVTGWLVSDVSRQHDVQGSSGIEMSNFGTGGCMNTQSECNRWLADNLSPSDAVPHPRRMRTSTTPSRKPNNSHFCHCLAFRCLNICNRLSHPYVHSRIRSFNQSRTIALSLSWSADVFFLFYKLNICVYKNAVLLGIARKKESLRCWDARIRRLKLLNSRTIWHY
jgi:hypothetical protein